MKLEGIITPIVTPFHSDESINFNATEQLCERLIEKGIAGIFVLGTNGEFHVMSDHEKLEFTEFVVKTVNHRVPVFAGTGGNSTRQVIDLFRQMEVIGVDVLSVITPYFMHQNNREILEYYRSIAVSVALPMILYNIPNLTGNNLGKELVECLANVDNIIAIKDSSGDMDQMKDFVEISRNKNFQVLIGSDSKILEALQLGASGAIAGTSNIITETVIDLYNSFKVGDLEAAAKDQNEIEILRKVNKKATQPSVFKEALNQMGIPAGICRRPTLPPTQEIKEEIRIMLDYFRL